MASISLSHDEVTTLTMAQPILAERLLEEIIDALEMLERSSTSTPLVIASAHPTIFLAGAHLGEIAKLDRRSCVPYAELGREVSHRLASHPAPVVAAVRGSCSGGGFDLVMACDEIIATPDAVFRHPGVHRGLVTGWGGTTSLGRILGDSVLRRALLEGSDLHATLLRDMGVVLRLADDPLAEARSAARRLARLHPSRLRLWRLLRGSSFVDRFRAFVVEKS